jgi:hypothetical protein
MRLRMICLLAVCFVWGFLSIRFGKAQAAAEYAGAVSSMGSVGTAAPKVPDKLPEAAPAQTSPNAKPGSPTKHPPARNGEPAEIKNRRELEGRAGKDAGKLLVRSTPAHARVWINKKLVGDTPLLLLLAPDQYRIELRGSRSGSVEQEVNLLPNETRELLMKLPQRYPSQVRLPDKE